LKKTLFDKIWEQHIVDERQDGSSLIYIDRHLVHEVTSPQAFEGLRISNRALRRPDLTLAVADHNVPTENRINGIKDDIARIQVETLEKNVKEFNVPYISLMDTRQGIVHVIGPEQGFTLPGCTMVCGDSHNVNKCFRPLICRGYCKRYCFRYYKNFRNIRGHRLCS
jgi:3-isopropylmalate/(R)-2-methylmalate dehydratase large subunit